jgi:hypothetical protein
MAYVLSPTVHAVAGILLCAVAVSEYLGCFTCYARGLNKIDYKVSRLKSSFWYVNNYWQTAVLHQYLWKLTA